MCILHISTKFCVTLSNTAEGNTVGLSGEPVVRLEGSRFFKKNKKVYISSNSVAKDESAIRFTKKDVLPFFLG